MTVTITHGEKESDTSSSQAEGRLHYKQRKSLSVHRRLNYLVQKVFFPPFKSDEATV
jgi:hypothetical protein